MSDSSSDTEGPFTISLEPRPFKEPKILTDTKKPIFKGLFREDLDRFIFDARMYLAVMKIPENLCASEIEGMLHGRALDWYKNTIKSCVNPERIFHFLKKHYLKNRYDELVVRKFYLEQQSSTQSTSSFVHKKIILLKWIPNPPSAKTSVFIILNLFHPLNADWWHLWLSDTPEEMLATAIRRERNTNYLTAENEIPFAAVFTRLNIATPPKCRNCSGRHFRKDCYTFKKKNLEIE